MKRVVIISDLHCGHRFGLTHPDFDARPQTPDSGSPAWKRYKMRRKCWRWFAKNIAVLHPIDLLIVNGDAIDGRAERSGGVELLTTDRNKQVDMAIAAIEDTKAKSILMTFGTPYHTGKGQDFERNIAKAVGALKIGGHDYVRVNGLLFDYKHHIGKSSIPHGRYTALAREKLWSEIWAERKEYPRSDVLIRSHVHYHVYCGAPGWMAVITPALQAYGTKYGSRLVSGTVDYGFVHFDVESREEFEWESHILRFKNARQQIVNL